MAMAPNATSASDGLNWNLVLGIGVILMLLSIFAFPTLMVVGIGFLPTLVAYICDRTEQKFATFCVGGMNLCGVFPYVVHLWPDDHSVPAATEVISDVFSLFVMYAAAGFGWMMFLAIPPVISSFLQVLAQSRVKTLRTLQRDIVEEWGPEVSVATDDDDGISPPA